jgi:chemotaxis response regulator CheB
MSVEDGDLFDVVLVDDSADIRLLVSLQLASSGRFRIVGEGSNGLEAVALARQLQPELLILDASMPCMNGLEALPKIRQAAPGTRVVMFSGFGGVAEEALRLGAFDFVPKSVPAQGLVSRLLDALARPLPTPR